MFRFMPKETIGGFNDQFPFKILFKVRSMYLSKKLVSLATEEKRNHKLLRIYICLLFRTVPKETTGAASTIQEKVEKKPSFISAARVARGLGLKR